MDTAHEIKRDNPTYDNYLGNANNNSKLASPICVTAIKKEQILIPVITTLWFQHIEFDRNWTIEQYNQKKKDGINLQEEFKTAIL